MTRKASVDNKCDKLQAELTQCSLLYILRIRKESGKDPSLPGRASIPRSHPSNVMTVKSFDKALEITQEVPHLH